MPFFNQQEQQRLMAQMFSNPQGGPMPPQPGGQGGPTEGGPMLAPSFVGPETYQPGGIQDLGVEPPDNFNRQVPNIGDQAMLRQPPNIGDQGMVQGMPPSVPSAGADNGYPIADQMGGAGDPRMKLIEAILRRQQGAF